MSVNGHAFEDEPLRFLPVFPRVGRWAKGARILIVW